MEGLPALQATVFATYGTRLNTVYSSQPNTKQILPIIPQQLAFIWPSHFGLDLEPQGEQPAQTRKKLFNTPFVRDIGLQPR